MDYEPLHDTRSLDVSKANMLGGDVFVKLGSETAKLDGGGDAVPVGLSETESFTNSDRERIEFSWTHNSV
jgi:hypothetical protein